MDRILGQWIGWFLIESRVARTRRYLEIAFVALAQLGADHALGPRHVLDGALDGDDAFHVETADVAQTAPRIKKKQQRTRRVQRLRIR